MPQLPKFLNPKPLGVAANATQVAHGPAAVAPPGTPPFPDERQEQSEWCWAAVTGAVLEVMQGRTVSQCRVVADYRGGAANGDPCTNPAGNNVQAPLAFVLPPYEIQPGDRLLPSGVDAVAAAAIDARLAAVPPAPVPIRMRWSHGGSHYVCVFGRGGTGTGKGYWVYDPMPEDAAERHRLESIAELNSYDGSGLLTGKPVEMFELSQ